MKWLLGLAFVATVAGVIVAIYASPSHTLHQVSAVFLVWLASAIVSYCTIAVMLAPCALTLRDIKGRDQKVVRAIAQGMDSGWFWFGFWASAAAWVVNTLIPLLLLVALPVWAVLGVFALNLATNAGAIPLRLWVWRIHKDRAVLGLRSWKPQEEGK